MALDWQTFKSNLGLSSSTSVFYIDDEGSNIPIDSEREFQEALRVCTAEMSCKRNINCCLQLAKLNKNTLKLVFCGDNLNPGDMVFALVPSVERRAELKLKDLNAVSGSKENVCSHGDVAPEWFTHYMKKFKKDIIHELKSYIHDNVHSAFEKLSCTKSEAGELFCEKNENPFSPFTTHTRKKKKSSERDLVDLIMDQRQLRLSKKINATKPERLEMLDQKTKALLEEKRRLLESKRKLEKNCFVTSSRSISLTESASFLLKEMCLTAERESGFLISVNMQNDGWCQWRSPQLVCFELEGVCLWEYNKYLPMLRPREICSVAVKGKLTPGEGPHYFKCRVVDQKMENMSPVFTCRFNVQSGTLASEKVKESGEVANQLRDTVGTLIDFEKDLINSSQKKIEENINEIERRLHDIELMQPSTSDGKEAKEAADALQTGCDLIQLENRLVQEEAKNDCAGLAAPSAMCNAENDKQRDKIPEGIFCKLLKSEAESAMCNAENDKQRDKIPEGIFCKLVKSEAESSDSEVSIVFLLDEEEEEKEEDDNFFVVPSESLSTAESANEDRKSPNVDSNVSPVAEEATKVKEQSAKPDTKTETPRREDTVGKETFQASPTGCRSSPFGKETPKPKESTEYDPQAYGQPGFDQQAHDEFKQYLLYKRSLHPEFRFATANSTHIPGFPQGFRFQGEKETESKKAREFVPDTEAWGRMFVRHSLPDRFQETFQGSPRGFRFPPFGKETPKPKESTEYSSPNVDSNVSSVAEEATKVREQSAKPDTKTETPRNTPGKETFQGSPKEFRFPPFGKETPKPKESTDYDPQAFGSQAYGQPGYDTRGFDPFRGDYLYKRRLHPEFSFATASPSQSTPSHIPGFSQGFRFPGEKETESKFVPHTEALGRTIYAVNSNGRCVPVEELFKHNHDGGEGSQSRQERRNDRFTDNPPLYALPNALRNGATNVASIAFNTAKSVINNLQSAFVTDGKTEMGTPAYEDQVKLSFEEAMIKLYDMGYLDSERNRRLLLRHKMKLTKVIDELVRLNENPHEEGSL